MERCGASQAARPVALINTFCVAFLKLDRLATRTTSTLDQLDVPTQNDDQLVKECVLALSAWYGNQIVNTYSKVLGSVATTV